MVSVLRINCLVCKKNKMRAAKRTNGRTYYFSKLGVPWKTSKMCHDCSHKITRKKLIEDIMPIQKEIRFHPTRKCKKCQGQIEVTRYFKCIKCLKDLPSIDNDFIYFTNSEEREINENTSDNSS